MKFETWVDTLDSTERHDEIKYKNYHQPWAQFIILIPGFEILHEPPLWIPDIEKWCKNNCTGSFDIDFYGYFELEEDSVLFGLRWA